MHGCVDPGDGSGLYVSESDCDAACLLESYDCTDNGCVDPGDGSGEYLDFSDCEYACNCEVYKNQWPKISYPTGKPGKQMDFKCKECLYNKKQNGLSLGELESLTSTRLSVFFTFYNS